MDMDRLHHYPFLPPQTLQVVRCRLQFPVHLRAPLLEYGSYFVNTCTFDWVCSLVLVHTPTHIAATMSSSPSKHNHRSMGLEEESLKFRQIRALDEVLNAVKDLTHS